MRRLLGVSAVLSVMIGLSCCSGQNESQLKDSKAASVPEVNEVEVVNLERTDFARQLLSNGKLKAVRRASLAFATSGIVIMYMVIGLEPSQMLSSTAVVSALEMPANLRFAMFTLVSIVPGISMLLCAIPMFFYKIAGQEKKNIIEALAKKRETSGVTVE